MGIQRIFVLLIAVTVGASRGDIGQMREMRRIVGFSLMQ
jgi:hypothetical protein